jgi:uncharacterized membrane protein
VETILYPLLTIAFLGLRALHVLVAGVWIGSTVFVSRMLTPVMEDAGPAGGQIMMRMNRALRKYMATVAVTTLVTGLYLLWHFSGGFDPGVMTSHAGLAFGTGGTAGILAGIIGGAVVGRSAAKATTIMGQATSLPDGPARGVLVQQAAALRQRMHWGSRAVVALQTIALVLMSVGHYV